MGIIKITTPNLKILLQGYYYLLHLDKIFGELLTVSDSLALLEPNSGPITKFSSAVCPYSNNNNIGDCKV